MFSLCVVYVQFMFMCSLSKLNRRSRKHSNSYIILCGHCVIITVNYYHSADLDDLGVLSILESSLGQFKKVLIQKN